MTQLKRNVDERVPGAGGSTRRGIVAAAIGALGLASPARAAQRKPARAMADREVEELRALGCQLALAEQALWERSRLRDAAELSAGQREGVLERAYDEALGRVEAVEQLIIDYAVETLGGLAAKLRLEPGHTVRRQPDGTDVVVAIEPFGIAGSALRDIERLAAQGQAIDHIGG